MFVQKHRNQNGQALLFVVVAMTIALSVGIAISTRTVTSLRRTSSTDTSSRVFAASEGGIEWFLRQPISVLNALSDGDNGGGSQCPTGTVGVTGNPAACKLAYQPQETDKIASQAHVKVQKFVFNDTDPSNNYYWFTINPGDVKEVILKDFQTNVYYRGGIDFCWDSLDTANSSAYIYYLLYSANGIQVKQLVEPLTVVGGPFNVQGDITAASGRLGYDSCYTLNISSDMEGLRFKALYSPAKVAVFASAAGFPTQGFKITSLGLLDNVAEQVKSSKEIIVYKSLPYAPSIFDYAIYSQGPID